MKFENIETNPYYSLFIKSTNFYDFYNKTTEVENKLRYENMVYVDSRDDRNKLNYITNDATKKLTEIRAFAVWKFSGLMDLDAEFADNIWQLVAEHTELDCISLYIKLHKFISNSKLKQLYI